MFKSRSRALLAFVGFCLFSPAASQACGGKAVPPSCGRTVTITGASPGPIFVDGGTFDFTQWVYFGLAEFPPGSGLCPDGPYLLDVEIAVVCTPSGDASAFIMDLPIVPGFTEIDLPLTIPPGPPRLCTVDSTATVKTTDGAEITGSGGGQAVCIVESAPPMPSLPRLDLELLEPGSPLTRVHPGGQSSHPYRLTNRDATATFTGELEVQTQNRSKVPSFLGSGNPGDGVFSSSDPGDADNFPIAFADQVSSCVPLPPDPLSAGIPIITRPIVLGPGESTTVDILTRPWGMCSGGSCSQSKAVVTGEFSDKTAGLACTSFVTATDLAAPPSYLWLDTGATALAQPLPDPSLGELLFVGFPTADPNPVDILAVLNGPQLILPGGQPVAGQLLAEQLDPERGRIRSVFDLPIPIQPDNPFELVLPIVFPPDPAGTVIASELVDFQWMQGAPIGFEDFQPLFMGTLDVTRMVGGNPFVTSFDFTLQLTLIGLDPLGLPLDPLLLAPLPLPLPLEPGQDGIELALQAVVLQDAAEIQRAQLDLDLRMHAYRGTRIFDDGFEAGDTSAWSLP